MAFLCQLLCQDHPSPRPFPFQTQTEIDQVSSKNTCSWIANSISITSSEKTRRLCLSLSLQLSSDLLPCSEQSGHRETSPWTIGLEQHSGETVSMVYCVSPFKCGTADLRRSLAPATAKSATANNSHLRYLFSLWELKHSLNDYLSFYCE